MADANQDLLIAAHLARTDQMLSASNRRPVGPVTIPMSMGVLSLGAVAHAAVGRLRARLVGGALSQT